MWHRFTEIDRFLLEERARFDVVTGRYVLLYAGFDDGVPSVPVYTLPPEQLAAALQAEEKEGVPRPVATYLFTAAKWHSAFSPREILFALSPPNVLEGWARYMSAHGPARALRHFGTKELFEPPPREQELGVKLHRTVAHVAAVLGLTPLWDMTVPRNEMCDTELWRVPLRAALEAGNIAFIDRWHRFWEQLRINHVSADAVISASASRFYQEREADVPEALSQFLRMRYFTGSYHIALKRCTYTKRCEYAYRIGLVQSELGIVPLRQRETLEFHIVRSAWPAEEDLD